MGAASDAADSADVRHSGDRSVSREPADRQDRIVSYHERSRSGSRSQTHSPSPHRSKKKRSRARSRSRSHHSSRKSKHRSRSRSKTPRKYSRTRRSRTHSSSRSRSGSDSPSYRRHRSHSRSPISARRRHTSSRDCPQPSRCLGVFGLSLYTTERQLHQIFSKYGRLETLQVIIDNKTGRSRGFCFVYYKDLESARAAKEQCSGLEIDGRKIRVDYSITERAHTPTPGIYMGRPTYSGDRFSRRRGRFDDGYERRGRRYRSPSPYYSRGRRTRYERSRSPSDSPREGRY